MTYNQVAGDPAFFKEIKYLVSASRADEIREWANAHFGTHPGSSIEHDHHCNLRTLYFDTEALDVYRKRGSYRRSKYKIRRFDSAETVILERKLRKKRRVSKRESVVGLDALEMLAQAEARNDWDGYWFHRRILLRRLAPVCQVSCERWERIAIVDNVPARLTIDQNTRALAVRTIELESDDEEVALGKNKAIVKLTFQNQAPVVFKHLIEQFALNPKSVSKYRLAAKALGMVPTKKSVSEIRLGEPTPCMTY